MQHALLIVGSLCDDNPFRGYTSQARQTSKEAKKQRNKNLVKIQNDWLFNTKINRIRLREKREGTSSTTTLSLD
jgi:hypothetical protein